MELDNFLLIVCIDTGTCSVLKKHGCMIDVINFVHNYVYIFLEIHAVSQLCHTSVF